MQLQQQVGIWATQASSAEPRNVSVTHKRSLYDLQRRTAPECYFAGIYGEGKLQTNIVRTHVSPRLLIGMHRSSSGACLCVLTLGRLLPSILIIFLSADTKRILSPALPSPDTGPQSAQCCISPPVRE